MEKKRLIIFTDIGDTVIDEGTEVRDRPCGVVLKADCIPEARETLLEMHRRGYTIVMVADGLLQSFRNTMEGNGLDRGFGWSPRRWGPKSRTPGCSRRLCGVWD